jgi:BirA family transcriptional regulator, biotin operon repressor / biotin---[acetyl-CoA-carboxylase] ligase
MITFCNKIIHVEEVDSTNILAEKLAAEEETMEGTVVLADFQQNGQGLAGNIWSSEPGCNVLMSMILFPEFLAPSNQFMLHKVVSLGVATCLKRHLKDHTVMIKWPNDIYVEGKKIAGILGKNIVLGEKLQTSILGVGLNVNQMTFDEQLPNPVSMAQIAGKSFDRLLLTEDIAAHIWLNYVQLREGRAGELNARYLDNLLNFDQPAVYQADGQKFVGIIRNVDHYGFLVVESGGIKREFDMKEIVLLTNK